MADVLPLFPSVPAVIEGSNGNVEANPERKCTGENGRDVDTVSSEESVVDGVGEGHCFECRRGAIR